ncbi:vacuolar protein sorting-associated protein 54-like isoform X1 [Stylophora pistillata]|uniref:vacuolar protein sorting-associated protein 54-like isoform X1 n=1 Tax=Stylophora pistillata TaxID=50429 RepID=UPI000C04F966|nr:vacuolar protein sorting-associated protein 54-like isoform X1 [Stylophora pistillata]
MLRLVDPNEVKPWQSCAICSDKVFFRTPREFSSHLRQVHCTKEGGSFVCRYGKNGVCPSLPVEGVSDKDYEDHVRKNHTKVEEVKSESRAPVTTDESLYPRPRLPPISFPNASSFTVYSSTQNLPAILNDPRLLKRQTDFFTKTWGEDFTSQDVPPLTLLPNIPKASFDDYLKKTEFRFKVHHKIKKNSIGGATTATPGDTGFTAAAVAAAKRQSVDKAASDISLVPKVFMMPNFALEDPEIFNNVLPWSMVTQEPADGARAVPRNSAKLLQEKLSHYLDITEVNLAHQISLRSEDFFSAMASQDQLQDHVGETISEIKHLRMKVQKVQEVLCSGFLNVLRLSSLRSKYVSVFEKLKLMATVHQTQPTIQLLLSTSDFVGALDLIGTTQEVLQQELAGIQSFRHLGSQLAELERVIERMMEADFVEFATANLTRTSEDDMESEGLVDEDRLASVLFGLLRKHKLHFLHLYRDEAYATIKSTVRQTVQDIVTDSKENEEESQSINDAMRGLDFLQWMNMLEKVFNASLCVLRRMRVLHQSIVRVLMIAAGGVTTHFDQDDLESLGISESDFLKPVCSGMDILINTTDYKKLTQESKELLCAGCEMAQLRCAKLINVRGKAGYLDSLSSAEFVRLTRMVEDFVMDCEKICGRQSHSLRATLLSQAKKFVERFHEERKNKLSLILDNERWKQADVPTELQSLVDSLVDGVYPRGKEPTFSIGPTATSDSKPSPVLFVNGEKFTVVGTVLLLVNMLVEYCQCVDDTPMLVTDIMNKLFETLKMFNSRTCQLVLGAGALQLVGLKTITAKHLALAARCLEVVTIHIPVFKAHFEERLPPKQYVLLSQFDQILKDYNNHRQELFSKIVNLMEELFKSIFSKWEVKAPMPSQAMRGAVKQITKLHESVSLVLPGAQVEAIFRDIKRAFKESLAHKLDKLGVTNDGGPQHGLVTSDLAFFKESLKNLNGMGEINRSLDDLWRTVNELRANRVSPVTGRKNVLQR